MSSNNNSLLDEFENSFQSCLSALTNPSTTHIHDSDEVKTSVEQTIQRFLDIARQIECFFLQKRLLLSVQKPELITNEDCVELKSEIAKKDQILAKYYEKLAMWQTMINETVAVGSAPNLQRQSSLMGGTTPQTSTLNASLAQQQQITQQLRAPNPQHSMMSSMVQSMTPPAMMSVPNASQMLPPQTSLPPTQSIMNQMPQTSNAQPMQQFIQQQQPPHGGLQGPLAYLERTTSNIGMSDMRR